MEEKKMTILIKNGRVINPATGTDETLDVLVRTGLWPEPGRVSSKNATA